MMQNFSVWLRAFRPPLQRAYPHPEDMEGDLADLLRLADERFADDDDPCTDDDASGAGAANKRNRQ